jgi:copper chaperone CopZ
MRYIFVVLLSIFSLSASAQFSKASIQASGLTCAMCTKAINNALEKVAFVQSVKSDISNSSFNLAFKPNARVDVDQLKKAVEDAGFSVSKMKLTANFNAIAVKNDEHVNINGTTFHFVRVADQTLSGQKEITMVDKNFIGGKEFKKYSASTKMACIHTGRAEACCSKKSAERIYHVTI